MNIKESFCMSVFTGGEGSLFLGFIKNFVKTVAKFWEIPLLSINHF